MKTREALAVVAHEMLGSRPTLVQPLDPFAGLNEETIAAMRRVAGRVAALGLPMEVNPSLANTLSFMFEGKLISMTAVNTPRGEEVVVSVQGTVGALSIADLMVMLPDPDPEPAPIALRLGAAPPMNRPVAAILEELLAEMKALRADLRAR
jgi:hypothetical protein